MSMNQVASDLYQAISESDERKVKPYDTKAEVLRTEGNIVWVKIPGGVDETPVQKTNNANDGDQVMVRISGGRAWLLGNETSPATDDTMANAATQLAEGAGNLAKVASDSAMAAQESARIAYNFAEEAQVSADNAQTSANIANNSAVRAINELGIIEEVVDVLNWISTHGTYVLTDDDVVDNSKYYFTLTGTPVASPSGSPAEAGLYELVDGTIYVLSTDSEVDPQKTYYKVTASVITNPSGNPSENEYYELSDIKDGVSNYVSSHLALTDEGLYLQNSNAAGYRLLISPTQGIILMGASGQLAKYGANASIGDPNSFHIEMSDNRLSFFRDAVNEIAYMSGDKLYITQSVVLQQMDVGTPMVGGVGGQWSWRIQPDSNGANNLYLKWLG